MESGALKLNEVNLELRLSPGTLLVRPDHFLLAQRMLVPFFYPPMYWPAYRIPEHLAIVCASIVLPQPAGPNIRILLFSTATTDDNDEDASSVDRGSSV